MTTTQGPYAPTPLLAPSADATGSGEKILWDAEFNPKTAMYWLANGALLCVVTIVLIPVLPFWLILGGIVTRRYLNTYKCTLTNRNLKVSRGIFVKQEKTVPLDRITDLGLVQGPIMRALDIEALSVETAGQSSAGSLIQLTGIKQGRVFRDAVLRQRDLVVGSEEERKSASPMPIAGLGGGESVAPILTEIGETLKRIERQLAARD